MMFLFAKKYKSRGAATIEASLISLTLILLIFSVFEYGSFSRDYLAASDGVQNAARDAASFGSRTADGGINGDMAAIQAIRASGGVVPLSYIEKIIIWKANPNSAVTKGPPEICLEAGVNGGNFTVSDTSVRQGDIRCNIYATKVQAAASRNLDGSYNSFTKPYLQAFVRLQVLDVSYFTCSQFDISAAPCGWPIEDRQDKIGPDRPPLDYIGVYVKVNHPYSTSFIGGEGITFESYTVRRLEISPDPVREST